MRWLNSITVSMRMTLSQLWEMAEDGEVWRAAVQGASKSRTWLRDRTTAITVLARLTMKRRVLQLGTRGFSKWVKKRIRMLICKNNKVLWQNL